MVDDTARMSWCSADALISASVFEAESVSMDTHRDVIRSSVLKNNRPPVSKSVTDSLC